jgi:hypothetical protein
MRTGSASLAILLGTLLGAPLTPLTPTAPLMADDVHLKNGRSFENVVAEVGDTQVRVHMPGGVISLPRSAVDRVDKSDSTFAEYLRRKQELTARERAGNGRTPRGSMDSPGSRSSPPTSSSMSALSSMSSMSSDWLELARWARSNNLPQGAREAALIAAQINPREPGLAGVLRGFGYVYEESLDRWISYDDAMRLHGFVQEGGTWVSHEEHAAHVREQLEARAAAAAAARDAAQAEMLQAQLGLAQQGGGAPAYDNGNGYGITLGGAYGGYGGFGGFWPYGGASVFGVPGFGLPGFGARRGFGERGFERRHEHPGGAGGPGNHFRGSVFGVPPAHSSFRSAPSGGRALRAAGRR